MKPSINELYKTYPNLETINEKLNGEIIKAMVFKKLQAGDLLKPNHIECADVILILKGKVRIEKLDREGKQMWLYELGPGEICHDALTCYMKCEPLELTAYAITDLEVAMIPIQLVNQHILVHFQFSHF